MVEVICDQCERINKPTASKCDRCGAELPESKKEIANETLLNAAADVQPASSTPALEAMLKADNIDSQQEGDLNAQELLAATTTGSGIAHWLIPLITASVLTTALQFYIAKTAQSADLFHNLLLSSEDWLQKAIPIAIIFIFFWSLSRLALQFVNLQKQVAHLGEEAVQNCPRLVAADQLTVARQRINEARQKHSISFVYTSVLALLTHLKSANDPQRSHEFLRHQAKLDAAAAQSADNTGRVFVWSMLMLGCIGAVFAAGLAVGDFSSFPVEDIDGKALQNNELAYAFNVVLLGLSTGLIVLLAASGVRRCESRLRNETEALCLRLVAQARVPEPDRSHEGRMENWFAQLKEELDSEASQRQAVFDNIATNVLRVGSDVASGVTSIEASLSDTKTAFIAELESAFTAIKSDMQGVGQEIAEAAKHLPATIANAQDTFGSELESALANVASRFENVSEQISGSYANLPAELDAVQHQFSNELKVQVEGQIAGLNTFDAAFNASVTTLAGSLTDMPAQLANAGEALADSATQVAQLKASIDAAAISSAEQTSAAQLLAQKVETLAISSEVTQQALASLQSLKTVLNELQQSQAKIAPLLNQLAGPHEIRIVPGQGMIEELETTE